MKGFIGKEYYVYCKDREEVLTFHELCKMYNLQYTNRWNAETEIIDHVNEATFVYDYDDMENDGVSFWAYDRGGDYERPMKPYCQIVDNLNQPEINLDDFLSIL